MKKDVLFVNIAKECEIDGGNAMAANFQRRPATAFDRRRLAMIKRFSALTSGMPVVPIAAKAECGAARICSGRVPVVCFRVANASERHLSLAGYAMLPQMASSSGSVNGGGVGGP
jgi:hypothetical protein